MIFGAFERMVALRYLRARRQEGFISVIAGFSFLGEPFLFVPRTQVADGRRIALGFFLGGRVLATEYE